MQNSWFVIVGLVGITLMISKGKVFNGLRTWLKSFDHPLNPSRHLGNLLSCSMCSGAWVGFSAALAIGSGWVDAVILGGLVSLTSWPTGEVFSAIERFLGPKEQPESRMMELLEARAQERQRRRAELRGKPPANIDESQAHQWLDEQDRLDEEVLSDPMLVRRYKENQENEEEAA